MHTELYSKNLHERVISGDLGVDGALILKYVLKEQNIGDTSLVNLALEMDQCLVVCYLSVPIFNMV